MPPNGLVGVTAAIFPRELSDSRRAPRGCSRKGSAVASKDRNSHSITFVGPEPGEASQARFWRPIANAWPAYAAPCTLRPARFEQILEDDEFSLGSALLAVIDSIDDTARIYQLVDRLSDASVPGVIMVPDSDERFARIGEQGVIVMPRSTPPVVAAATLAALAERQPMVDLLNAELRTARRFQGGLRGEMERIHDELQLAASVQREFLPHTLPQVEGIDFRVLFRPAGYVSGDIYDVQRLDDHTIGFFVADAVGHGVPAALMTMVLAKGLTTHITTEDTHEILAPAEVLERLNREMVRRHADVPRFATAVYGTIDINTRRVTLAGAGHPPPLRMTTNEVTKVETSGGLLGVFADDKYDQVEFTLDDDEMLLIYSDGFETAFPCTEDKSSDRKRPTHHYLDHFREASVVWREDGLAGAMRRLTDALDSQRGSLHQIDDLTALLIVPGVESGVNRSLTGSTKLSVA